MDFSLKLITAPAVEPVALSEVKLHAHIDHDVQDSIISDWIASGRIAAETFQRRAYIAQVWEMAFDGFPSVPISIPRPPLIGVISIKCYDCADMETVLYSKADNPATDEVEAGTDLATNSDFIIDTHSQPGRIMLAYGKSWPSITERSINTLIIQFAAGYGLEAHEVPETVKDAIMLYCTARNENRAGEEDFLKAFHNLLYPNRVYL